MVTPRVQISIAFSLSLTLGSLVLNVNVISRASYIQPVLSGKRKLGASRETESTQETADKGKVLQSDPIKLIINALAHPQISCMNLRGLRQKKRPRERVYGEYQPSVSFPILVTLSCPILCDSMDCSPPGFSVHGILQTRILEWLAIPFSIPFSRGSS